MQAALVEEALVGCGLWQPNVVKRAFSRRAGLAQDVRMEQGEEHTSGGGGAEKRTAAEDWLLAEG